MIDKLNTHYSMTNPASVYDEESLTALELAGRTTAKVNEVVDAQNKLDENVTNTLNTQNQNIENIRTVTVPADVSKEVQKQIENGTFDNAIDTYAGGLESRVDNLLGSVSSGSTTMDAEIIDARQTYTGGTLSTLGNALRYVESLTQKRGFIGAYDLAISFDTTNKTVTLNNTIYVTDRNVRYDVLPTTLSYNGGTQTFKYLVLDYETKLPKIIDFNDYNKKDVIVFLFSSSLITNPNFVTYPFSYSVDGVVYKSGEFKTAEIVTNDVPVFDSSTGLMTTEKPWYCFYNGVRYIVNSQSVNYLGNQNSRYMVIDMTNHDVNNAVLKSIDYNKYNANEHILLFAYTQSLIVLNGLRHNISLNTPFIYDGARYELSNINLENTSYEKVGYISPNGNDSTGDGTKSKPFKTFTAAVAKGFNILKCAEGVYKISNTSLSNMDKLKIMCEWGTHTTTNPTRKGVVIDNSETLSMSEDTTLSLLKCDFSSPYLNQIFVTQELTIKIPSNNRNANRVDVWKFNETHETSLKLTPVLTVTECQTTENSWTYDGSKVYVNSEEGVFKMTINSNFGMSLTNINNVVLEDITFLFNVGDGVRIANCNSVKLKNCHSGYSSSQNGFSLNYCNVDVVNCTAFHNQNDGFNLHYFGNSSFINCQGYHNNDDGISHHEDCNGVIIGGKYHHNGKGGIASPTYGSVVDIHNAMLFNNAVGVYAHEDTETPKEFTVSNCAIFNNTIGIRSSYNCYSVNNRLKDNGTDIDIEFNGSVTVI